MAGGAGGDRCLTIEAVHKGQAHDPPRCPGIGGPLPLVLSRSRTTTFCWRQLCWPSGNLEQATER